MGPLNPTDPIRHGDDSWTVGGVTLQSRFLLGTAGYPSPRVLADAVAAGRAAATASASTRGEG